MSAIGDRLRRCREDRRWSQEDLAKRSSVSQTTISDIERGRNEGSKHITAIASALGVNPRWLTTGRGEKATSSVEAGPDILGLVPLISWVRAGEWDEAVDTNQPGYADDWKACPTKHGPHTYALRVRGDSMTAPYGKTYPDGCLVFVDPDLRSPANGARIIAKLKGSDEVTFKVFVQEAGRAWLKPLNPQHPPILEPFRVLGTVIGKWEEE